MTQVGWLWNYLKGKRSLLVIGFFLSALTSTMIIINPMLAQRLIDNVIVPQNTEPLIPLLLTMLIVQVVRMSLRYVMHLCLEQESNIAMTKIRRDMYETVQHQDYKFLSKFPTGNLMTRMTQDLERLRHTVSWVTFMLVDCVVLFTVSLGFLVFVNWQLALCLTAITPAILYVSRRFIKIIRPRFVLLRQKLTNLGTVVTENINGNKVVRAFTREDHEIEKFEKHNDEFRDVSCENALIAARYNPVLEALSHILIIETLVIGGIFLINGSMTPGQYLAFSSLTWALSAPLRMLATILADLERYNATGAMLREVIEAPKGICDAPDAIELKERPKGKIEFKSVNFSIDDTPILKDISFTINPGQTLGILGSTGSGKTSLVNLLVHTYEPDSGEILLDNVAVEKYTLSSLRHNIGLAMQEVFLFSDSVRANIAFGRPAPEPSVPAAQTSSALDEETIINCAVKADADCFIRQMEAGYDTLVGERGVGLSGGQRQRISLARALAVSPAILILDDTTSSVDSETEQYIQEQLRNLDFPCTKIIIAQRISSFRDADQILVMDKGQIIERGNHKQLLAMKGYYHNIWKLQYNTGKRSGRIELPKLKLWEKLQNLLSGKNDGKKT